MIPDFRRQCGWCHTIVAGYIAVNCTHCAGPLPALPVSVAEAQGRPSGEPPPASPRHLPQAYLDRVGGHQSNMPWVLLLAAIVFSWTLIVPVFCAYLYLRLRSERDWVLVLQTGQAVLGEISEIIAHDRDERDPAYTVHFGFEVDGTSYQGSQTSDDPSTGFREAGERVWVVFDRDEPGRGCSLWPPAHGLAR